MEGMFELFLLLMLDCLNLNYVTTTNIVDSFTINFSC